MSRTAIWWNGVHPDIDALNRACAGTMMEWLDIRFTACGDDWLRASMPVGPRSHQPFGRLHGGASVALAETVGSMAAGRCVDPALFLAVGMEINANHVRPVHDGLVEATAHPESLGRSTQLWSIRIVNGDGKLVCLSRLTIAIIPAQRK